MPTLSFRLFLAFASVAILVHSPCFANDNTQAPVTTNSRRLESPAPVELQPPSHQAKTFVPSSQVNYDETVIIKAPPPEEAERQAIPVKRFGWLRLESKPLNPAQQNR
ncbi:MAG: hypothetical protein NTW61_08250 [Candidatus Melainabacteria bacterium]|jgi:hypothetical protein|nr:hypothetical protein [Candidatus Melainabacteria bacterium]